MISSTTRSLPTGMSKFTKALRRIKEVLILVAAHVIANTTDVHHIWTSLAQIPKTPILGKSLNALNEGSPNFCSM